MIPNQWYAVLDSREVPRSKPVGVTRMGEKLVFWRDSTGGVVCQRDLCPHRGVALSAGKVINDRIQCPFHGFEFDSSGKCALIPANSACKDVPKGIEVHTYPARDEHGLIWIWWGEPPAALPPIRFFDGLDDMSYGTIKDHWAVHYSRAIENQLDVMHLPFVHHNTIGRGNKTIVDGPYIELDEENHSLSFWVHNRVEDCNPPLRPQDITNPKGRPNYLQLCFPNVWLNYISPNVQVFVAFAPIDDANTMMYLRMYQKVSRAPVLRQITNTLGSLGNLFIARQDKRVVITQRPLKTAFKMSERLVQGDLPITAYRKHRRALKAAAGLEEETLRE
ncbi:MAG: aromatic ring-hydroxylating dioxygenase subunit alpha [Anaerolineae bacterium]|nr:aromatic ring-hydroxylating dioxygenase subunit alpha [Anaerolineae bacterium]